MADSTGENDSSIVVRNRGQKPEEQTNSTADQQIEPQQNPNQAPEQPQQEAGSAWKGMIIRMVIFYLIINFFRSKGPSTPTNNGSPKVDTGPCINVFKDGDLMVRYRKILPHPKA